MKLGDQKIPLDRRITLQYAVKSRDTHGGEVVTWYELATVFARYLPVSGRRLFAAESKGAEALASFQIRFRPNVEALMRVVYGAAVYEITAVGPLGRRQYLELACRGVSQLTGDPRALLDAGDGVTFLDAGDGSTYLDAGVAA